jgi:hypothetical protein
MSGFLIALIGGLFFCSILLARRLITMLVSSKPYWGGSATEGYIDKFKQPGTHAFYVSVTAFGLTVCVGLASLFAWSLLQ